MSRPYTITQLAAAAGVTVEAVRYYQRLKLVPEPPRPIRGIRRYSEADAERLRFVKRARAMGFSLAETSSLVGLQVRPSCREARELATGKLSLLDSRIRELRALRKELAGLIADCEANTQDSKCPVIQRLTTSSSRSS